MNLPIVTSTTGVTNYIIRVILQVPMLQLLTHSSMAPGVQTFSSRMRGIPGAAGSLARVPPSILYSLPASLWAHAWRYPPPIDM
ncbi:hypothetical protein GDO78_013696 [Eleutherodactylus coqui]|uniref:Uncharacterized protein n=1 Tax=Eleutherodactylus coqui TaxID=57060 RepID=A0A8J6AY57_ELECQ|nr:hypothetical protein GDO78_013696 [Eleutherodactylus coqui]